MAQALTKKSLTRSLSLICNAIGSSPIRNPNSLSKFLSYRAPEYKETGVKTFHVRGVGHIAEDKPMEYALRYAYGIGRSRARIIASQLGITNKRGRDMSLYEKDTLRDGAYSNYLLEHDLGRVVDHDIARLKDIHCYRGARHEDKLPCRGQRTCTNARTLKDVHLRSEKKEKKKRERMRRRGYLVY